MERITVSVNQNHRNYEAALQFLTDGLGETGFVSNELMAFVTQCVERFGADHFVVPITHGEFETGKLHVVLRPRIAVIGMDPPEPKFRDEILRLARESRLVALDHQNGFLFTPPDRSRKPWWKFW